VLPEGYYPTYIKIRILCIMVAQILDEDSFGKISYDEENSQLTLEWLEATKDMIAPDQEK